MSCVQRLSVLGSAPNKGHNKGGSGGGGSGGDSLGELEQEDAFADLTSLLTLLMHISSKDLQRTTPNVSVRAQGWCWLV